MDYSITAKRLKELRQSKKLSHEQLSEKLKLNFDIDINSRTLMNYESAAKDILHSKASSVSGMSIEKLDAIARFYNVSTDYLLGFTTIKTADPDLKFICDYTGLSERSINRLSEWAENNKNGWVPLSLNFTDYFIIDYAERLSELAFKYRASLKKSIMQKEGLLKNIENIDKNEFEILAREIGKNDILSDLSWFRFQELAREMATKFTESDREKNKELEEQLLKFQTYQFQKLFAESL